MTLEEAAKLLAKKWEEGESKKEKALYIHLFAIEYADQIANMSLRDLALRAGLTESFKTELRKGINLAKHVLLRSKLPNQNR